MIQDLLKKHEAVVMVTLGDLREFAQDILKQQKDPEDEQMYTPEEFAQRMKISKSTLWRWCKIGILKRTVVGTKIYFKDSDLATLRP